MKPEIHYFSPTGGGQKIAQVIARGLMGDEHGDHKPAIFAIPVYGGHMPELAKEVFKQAKAEPNQPAILVAVYGNRAFEHALTDLEDFVKQRGFVPVAAAAFVCEHSYSTPETPIAAGRPDAKDLEEARRFGEAVREKLLANDLSAINAADLKDDPMTEKQAKDFMAAVVEARARMAASGEKPAPRYHGDKCTRCGACVSACPTGAIKEDMSLDVSRCIACCACEKTCPTNARTYISPLAKALSENFPERKANRYTL